MPTQVKGEDGRVLHDNLSDHDAADLARTVHTNTGEVVTLTPYRFNGDEYVLDHEGARTIGTAAEPEPEPVVEQAKEPETETPKRAPRAKKEPAAPAAPARKPATKK